MATKTIEYFVRPNLNLHRIVSETRQNKEYKAVKLYQGGDKVEDLTPEEFKRYQHLLETAEQVKSRGTNKTTGEK